MIQHIFVQLVTQLSTNNWEEEAIRWYLPLENTQKINSKAMQHDMVHCCIDLSNSILVVCCLYWLSFHSNNLLVNIRNIHISKDNSILFLVKYWADSCH